MKEPLGNSRAAQAVMIKPREYTAFECDSFSLWDGGEFPISILANTNNRHNIIINEKQVHSFIFESPAAGHGNFARWDCLNGWTTTIDEAKKRFPSGFHTLYWDDAGDILKPRLANQTELKDSEGRKTNKV